MQCSSRTVRTSVSAALEPLAGSQKPGDESVLGRDIAAKYAATLAVIPQYVTQGGV